MTRKRYCPYGCHNGWIEAESPIGTTCPEHPPLMPMKAVVNWAEPDGIPARVKELRAMPYEEYLQTPEWASTRRAAQKEANFTCQAEGCGSRNDLQVHHLTYEHRGSEYPWELIVLCRSCHEKIHGIESEATS